MREKFERWSSRLLTVATAVLAAVVLRREFAPKAQLRGANSPPSYVTSWESLEKNGQRWGAPTATVRLIEFSDYECPVCRKFSREVVEPLRKERPTGVSVTYLHFPLPYHRFAVPAGIAAECAAVEGRFWEMSDALFSGQDSLGLKSWAEFAVAAGIRDSAQFSDCLRTQAPRARVESGLTVAKSLQLQGTPTVLINGWKLSRLPSLEEVRQAIRRVERGQLPFDTLVTKAP